MSCKKTSPSSLEIQPASMGICSICGTWTMFGNAENGRFVRVLSSLNLVHGHHVAQQVPDFKRLSFLKKRYRPLGKGKTSFLTLVHSIFREFVILAFPCVTLFTLCVCLSMQSRSSLCSFSYLYTPFIKSLRSLHGFAFRIGLVVVRWWIHFLKNENISIYWLHTLNIICLWKTI